jgi:hypothetical protein
VDLDAGIADRADGDRQGEALQQRKVDSNMFRRICEIIQILGTGGLVAVLSHGELGGCGKI